MCTAARHSSELMPIVSRDPFDNVELNIGPVPTRVGKHLERRYRIYYR